MDGLLPGSRKRVLPRASMTTSDRPLSAGIACGRGMEHVLPGCAIGRSHRRNGHPERYDLHLLILVGTRWSVAGIKPHDHERATDTPGAHSRSSAIAAAANYPGTDRQK